MGALNKTMGAWNKMWNKKGTQAIVVPRSEALLAGQTVVPSPGPTSQQVTELFNEYFSCSSRLGNSLAESYVPRSIAV
jgi:hypothetical protein